MNNETELIRHPAGRFAWFAARDARKRSLTNSTLYSDAQKITAERVKLGLEICYSAKDIYIEYRKKFISIKINKPTVRDRKALALLESDYDKFGYEKCKTAAGITYRLFK
jgi:hypothetical protein